MIYMDPLHKGEVEFPDFIEDLIATPQFQRLKYISLDSLPLRLLHNVISRAEHSLGTGFLACLVNRRNFRFEKFKNLLLVSAILHDVGSPPFSHLSEPFLEDLMGVDGEGHLSNILKDSEAERILENNGLSLDDVVHFVSGKAEPFSHILNGSMDLDNLDNIGRYWWYTHIGERPFDAVNIASSFKFMKSGWRLRESCFEEVKKWQETRKKVYERVYAYPNVVVSMMIYRAIHIAYYLGEITEEFFRMTDDGAIDFLKQCNRQTANLVQNVIDKKWYLSVTSWKTQNSRGALKKCLQDWNAKGNIADDIAREVQLPRSSIAVYIEKEMGIHPIDIPFVNYHGYIKKIKEEEPPTYGFAVYMDPEEFGNEDIKASIKRFVGSMCL